MKVIIAGSRDLSLRTEDIAKAVAAAGHDPHTMVCVTGGAPGIDQAGDKWARENNVDRVVLHANWGKHRRPGRKNPAGPIRNGQMADYADALIAIYRKGKLTPGTRDMIKQARAKGLKVYEHEV